MTVSDTPHRPHSDDDDELGFAKATPVRWLSPSMLVNTAGQVVLSDVFGEYLDKRDLQVSLPCDDLRRTRRRLRGLVRLRRRPR